MHGYKVSTHSRPKAAGIAFVNSSIGIPFVSTHSRPKAAGAATSTGTTSTAVSTHSRPKAAGSGVLYKMALKLVSTHSRPKAAGVCKDVVIYPPYWFQHTAARRRLERLL